VAKNMKSTSRAKNFKARISSLSLELLNMRISMNLNKLKKAVVKNAKVMAVSMGCNI